MRTTYTTLICTLYLTTLTPSPAAAQAAKPKVAVLLLVHDDDVTDGQQAQVRASVRATLETREHVALPSAEVDRLVGTTNVGCATGPCMARTANTVGVDRVVGGRLERVGGGAGGWGTWTLTLWLYDVRTRETAAVHTAHCKGCGAVQAVATAIRATSDLLNQVDANRGCRVLVRSRPSNARVIIDGVERGVTDLAFGVKPGRHTVVLKKDGFFPTTHTVEVEPGAEAVVQARLASSSAVGPAREGVVSPGLFKWVALGAAVATLGAGIALMVMDGEETCDKTHGHHVCPERYETMTPGVALVATGAALGGAAGLLFILDGGRESPRKTMAIAPTITRGGGGVAAALTF